MAEVAGSNPAEPIVIFQSDARMMADDEQPKSRKLHKFTEKLHNSGELTEAEKRELCSMSLTEFAMGRTWRSVLQQRHTQRQEPSLEPQNQLSFTKENSNNTSLYARKVWLLSQSTGYCEPHTNCGFVQKEKSLRQAYRPCGLLLSKSTLQSTRAKRCLVPRQRSSKISQILDLIRAALFLQLAGTLQRPFERGKRLLSKLSLLQISLHRLHESTPVPRVVS